MIPSALRWIARLDRSYFLALTALIASIIASVTLAFAPTVERFDGTTVTWIEENGAGVIVLLVLPVLVLAAPLVALPQKPGPRRRNDKINSLAATGVMLAFAFAFLTSLGLLYLPAVILSTSSSASLFFGKNRKLQQATAPQGDAGADGVRLSRSARKRLRQEELAIEESGESPLTSSRRRRGRNRRNR